MPHARRLTRLYQPLALALGLALGSLFIAMPAHAGPLDEARIKARVQATGSGNVEALMADYADNAVFQWVGGPFDGEYRGKDAIRDVWTRFFANQGPMQLTAGKVDSNTNPKGVTVNTYANYKGKLDVKVRQIFVIRDSKVVMEIWQIDPALNIAQ